ncbi:MAG: hypothetical protein E6J37_03640 [Chloroflexi bacterium]|nr:MAG: hypothetical protein E6J37_03640 [Chloroflexota bacterium]
MDRVHVVLVGGVLIMAMVACAPAGGSGKFTMANAHVDPSYTCPNPAEDFAYDVHGTIDADNGTGSQVTIQSMSSTTTTVATHGSWLGPLGEIDDESDLLFSPNSVGSGSKTTVHFTIPFGCTDTPHVGILDTYGEFAVHVSVVTSAGTFELDANRHRLKTP